MWSSPWPAHIPSLPRPTLAMETRCPHHSTDKHCSRRTGRRIIDPLLGRPPTETVRVPETAQVDTDLGEGQAF